MRISDWSSDVCSSDLFTTLAPGLFEAGAKLIDRLIPDPAQREQAKLALFQAEGQQALQEMQVSLSAILAEANSADPWTSRSEEHTSELQSLMRISYAVFCLKKKKTNKQTIRQDHN